MVTRTTVAKKERIIAQRVERDTSSPVIVPSGPGWVKG